MRNISDEEKLVLKQENKARRRDRAVKLFMFLLSFLLAIITVFVSNT